MGYWQMCDLMAKSNAERGEGFWVFTLGPLHVFNAIFGREVFILWMMGLYVIQPLVPHVMRASRGITYVELLMCRQDLMTELPNGQKVKVPIGAFARDTRFENLLSLLGPSWRWRLLCPMRGSPVA